MTPRCAPAWRRCGLRDPATGSPPVGRYTLGAALLSRGTAAERGRGLELMVQVREVVRPRGRFLVPVVDLWVARLSARRGGRDAGISVMRQAVNELHQ